MADVVAMSYRPPPELVNRRFNAPGDDNTGALVRTNPSNPPIYPHVFPPTVAIFEVYEAIFGSVFIELLCYFHVLFAVVDDLVNLALFEPLY